MVIVLKEKTTKEQKDQLVKWVEAQGLKVHESDGEYKTIDIEQAITETEKATQDILDRL